MGRYFNVPQQPRTMDALNEGLQNILLLRQQQADKNQKRMAEINKEMEALDPIKLSEERDQKYAAEAIARVHEMAANSMTFKDGKPKKIRDFFYGPELDDMEQAEIYKLINTEAAEIGKRKSSNDLMKKESEEFNRNQEKYDGNYFNKQMERYRNEPGYVPEAKSYLSIAPNLNIEDALSDPKNDPRTELERKGNEIPDGNFIITRTPSALPEQQRTVYNAALRSNPSLAKGAVYRFINDASKTYEEKKAYVAGSLMKNPPNDPNVRKAMIDMNLEKADKIMADFRDDVKVDPALMDAAIFWGENDQKWQENVGKGGERRDLNQGAYNDMLRRQREKADKGTEAQANPLQTRKITFAGNEYPNYVDISNVESTNTTLTGFRLPKDAVKLVEKIDIKTGKPMPIKVKGKEEKAIRITNPIETKTENDYIVNGWDRDKNIIRLTLKNKEDLESGEQESYMIPYVGNEIMIKEITNKIGAGEDYLNTTLKYDKYKRR
jgi:hypothetical protein